MGRKKNSRKSASFNKSRNTSIEDLFLTDSHYETPTPSRFSPDSLHSLRKELKDAIEKIYSTFLDQFEKLKTLKITCQYPISIHNKNVSIEKNYCNELTQKVKQLVHLDSLDDIYFTFRKSVSNFMEKIFLALQDLKNSDPLLQLACLGEAYFIIGNSCEELGKVTSGIFDQRVINSTCESVTKIAFLEKVVKNYSEMIKKCKEDSENSEIVMAAENMEKELLELSEKLSNSIDTKAQNPQFLSPLQSTDFSSVDEIVKYINGDSQVNKKKNNKSRRISKASTAETSISPFSRRSYQDFWKTLEDHELDKEVEEFETILNRTQPLSRKFKPSLSDEWLEKIRNKILKKN